MHNKLPLLFLVHWTDESKIKKYKLTPSKWCICRMQHWKWDTNSVKVSLQSVCGWQESYKDAFCWCLLRPYGGLCQKWWRCSENAWNVTESVTSWKHSSCFYIKTRSFLMMIYFIGWFNKMRIENFTLLHLFLHALLTGISPHIHESHSIGYFP